MGSYSRFDARQGVILTDVTNLAGAKRADIDAIFDELIALARSLPARVYVVACWKNVSFADPMVANYYGQRTKALLEHVAGVVRYGANDPLTRAYVRAQSLKHSAEGTRSNLFETFEEAIGRVRALERGES